MPIATDADAAALMLQTLVVRAQTGDRDAFSELVAEQYDFIFRTAYKWCGRREDAEDVAQDVCIKLARILSGFEGRSGFQSWLYRVVLNAVRDMQRQKGRTQSHMIDLNVAALSVPASRQDDAEVDAELWRAVRQLPPRQCDSVLLVYAEQKTHAEAAAILGCSESTVSYHVHAARKALRTVLTGEPS